VSGTVALRKAPEYIDANVTSCDVITTSCDAKEGVLNMLEALLGSTSCEQVLLFINAREEGYSREIARFFDVDYRPIRNQLDKLEAGGILYSRRAGKTRLFSFDPRCPFLQQLKAMLEKVMEFCPDDLMERLACNRRRPRQRGKPQ
jgi:hypothetical protein